MAALQSSSDRRLRARYEVDYPVIAEHRRLDDRALRIVSISPRGFMATGATGLGRGERVSVRLPVVGTIEAHLAWLHEGRGGFQFERVIAGADFERMIPTLHPLHVPRGGT